MSLVLSICTLGIWGPALEAETPSRQGNPSDFLREYHFSIEKRQLGWPELIFAIDREQYDIAKKLIDSGANPNAKSIDGTQTPLSKAIEKGNAELVQKLIDKGADVNLIVGGVFDKCMPQIKSSEFPDRVCGPDEYSPLMLAIQYHQPEIVGILLENKADSNYRSYLKYQPVHLAVRHNQPKILTLLVNKGVDVNSKDLWGYAPLHYGAFMGDKDNVKEIAEILFERGANVNQKIDSPVIQFAPLHLAALNGHVDFVQQLIQHSADVNLQDIYGATPLWYAVYSPIESRDIVRGLIRAGADVNYLNKNEVANDPNHPFGQTPLILAIELRKFDTADLLLQNGANIEIIGQQGTTPLLVAVQNNDLEAVAFLLKHGANPINQGKLGKGPIDLAMEKGYSKVLDALISSQAKHL